MTVKELLAVLADNPSAAIGLKLPDGALVPAHFHVTEVGRVQKDFIDCGGGVRAATSCLLQVWVADDVEHRLRSGKLGAILQLAAPLLKSTDLPVEIEYEAGVVSQYPLTRAEVASSGVLLHLGRKRTACLAPDRCGVDTGEASCCPTSGCC